ncbi:hypothetical protein E4K67_01900 [Desulfosporosinus fructosivorans]|uniref:DUF1640 domain-containing protein n=1 Tax=Desulfosporosinus fructosivorans TaxID=2018669 RepID=A0A4Z0RAG8_9FIRM|nr:hypothetical protein [Desulfosporosinus fructosivorans]TGE39770.1 hypothetical protein E4K67_01900 [Desulfosporosinus fructosivorans]
MDPKVMELLANIYQTQTEMRIELKEFRSELKELRSEMQSESKELRSEMQSELIKLRSEIRNESTELRGEMQSKFDVLRMDQETLAQNVAKIKTVIEHDIAQKIGAIFDFREMQKDYNQTIGQTLERIEAKLEVLQLETSNLRRIK